MELATRFHVSEVWDAGCNAVEVGEFNIDTRFICDRQQVEHRICRTSKGIRQRDRILKCPSGEDVMRTQTRLQHVDDGLSGTTSIIFSATINRWRRRRTWQA